MSDDNEVAAAVTGFALVVGAFGLVAAGAMIDGFVLSKLWGWFVIPAFGIARLSVPAAIGITLIGGRISNRGASSFKNKTTGDVLSADPSLPLATIAPFVVLGIGYVVHLFM